MAQNTPFTTLAEGIKVVVVRKTYSEYSRITADHIGKIFTINSWDYGGRTHNKFICCIHIHSPRFGAIYAVIDELSLLNPNCEPEGEFVVCIGCGASMAESELLSQHHIRGIKACPSCGILEPTES